MLETIYKCIFIGIFLLFTITMLNNIFQMIKTDPDFVGNSNGIWFGIFGISLVVGYIVSCHMVVEFVIKSLV